MNTPPTSILENLQMWEGSVHRPEALTRNGEKTLERRRAVANCGQSWVWGRQHAAVGGVGPEQGRFWKFEAQLLLLSHTALAWSELTHCHRNRQRQPRSQESLLPNPAELRST